MASSPNKAPHAPAICGGRARYRKGYGKPAKGVTVEESRLWRAEGHPQSDGRSVSGALGTDRSLRHDLGAAMKIENWHRRQAFIIASQLPENQQDALAVLEAARELVATFLQADATEAPKAPVVVFVRPRPDMSA
jgi:hypothetical protein